ncbi:MAG: glycosyltransferase [Paludibacteraceae bacterium]|nr:glycosyltransferase [Paludibacteraceae bacterium]
MSNTVEKIKTAIESLENKKFKFYFFVFDTKGAPNGSLAYIYETAKILNDEGYKVEMLYAEPDFVGVDSWLGEEYSSLPHSRVGDRNSIQVTLGPDDFVFIPEIYSNVMSALKSYPCKRIALLQNFGYVTEVIPTGASWDDLKVRDCIATSESLKERLHTVFPEVKTEIVHRSVPSYFKQTGEKKLIVNVIVKNQSEASAIVKPFMWKFPQYGWVSFRPLLNRERKDFAERLSEGFATVWCDTTTDFGQSALEAMAARSIVIGKIPENIPEWMGDSKVGSIKNNGMWFYNNLEAQDAIASVVQSFITESIPQSIYDEMAETVKDYSPDRQKKEVLDVYGKLVEDRKKELTVFLSICENKEKENEKAE